MASFTLLSTFFFEEFMISTSFLLAKHVYDRKKKQIISTIFAVTQDVVMFGQRGAITSDFLS